MALTTQALVLAIVYVVSVLVGLFMTIKAGAFNIAAFLGTILTLGFIALLVYDTQCLTTGNCTIWSWVRTAIYIFFPALSLVLGFFALFSGNKMEQPMSQPPMQPSFKFSEQYMNEPEEKQMQPTMQPTMQPMQMQPMQSPMQSPMQLSEQYTSEPEQYMYYQS